MRKVGLVGGGMTKRESKWAEVLFLCDPVPGAKQMMFAVKVLNPLLPF